MDKLLALGMVPPTVEKTRQRRSRRGRDVGVTDAELQGAGWRARPEGREGPVAARDSRSGPNSSTRAKMFDNLIGNIDPESRELARRSGRGTSFWSITRARSRRRRTSTTSCSTSTARSGRTCRRSTRRALPPRSGSGSIEARSPPSSSGARRWRSVFDKLLKTSGDR